MAESLLEASSADQSSVSLVYERPATSPSLYGSTWVASGVTTIRPSRLPRSITVSAVITFVSDAIGRRMFAPRAASTRPDAASIATNDGASTFAGAATVRDAGTAGPGTATTTRASTSRAPRSRLSTSIIGRL